MLYSFGAIFVSVAYDPVKLYEQPPFKVADIGINAILLRANKDLLWLLKHFKAAQDDIAQVQEWVALQQKTIPQFWNEKIQAYSSIDLITGKQIDVLTSGSFLPFLRERYPKSRKISCLKNWRTGAKKGFSCSPALILTINLSKQNVIGAAPCGPL